jgi:hypothetical protein
VGRCSEVVDGMKTRINSMRTFMQRFAVVAIAVVFVGAVVNQLLPPSEAARALIKDFATVETFSLGEVGFASSIPEREEWFFAILSSRHSDRLFRELFEQGTSEAKVYALAGLRLTDGDGFKECAGEFVCEGSDVRTQRGCIGRTRTAAEMVAAFEGGEVERYIKVRRERRLKNAWQAVRREIGMEE